MIYCYSVRLGFRQHNKISVRGLSPRFTENRSRSFEWFSWNYRSKNIIPPVSIRRAIQKKKLHNFRHCPKLLYLPTPKANLDIISFGQFDFSLTPPPPSIIWTYFNNYVKILQAISSTVRYQFTHLLILKTSL